MEVNQKLMLIYQRDACSPYTSI